MSAALTLFRLAGDAYGMFDGSVRRLSPRVTPQTLRIAITPDDGQILPPDW